MFLTPFIWVSTVHPYRFVLPGHCAFDSQKPNLETQRSRHGIHTKDNVYPEILSRAESGFNYDTIHYLREIERLAM